MTYQKKKKKLDDDFYILCLVPSFHVREMTVRACSLQGGEERQSCLAHLENGKYLAIQTETWSNTLRFLLFVF